MAQTRTEARRRAVVSVDQINSFFEDGQLPVPGASKTIKPSNTFLRFAEHNGYSIVFVVENHPEESNHFKPKGPWPKHGIRGTWGAQFRAGLYLPKTMKVFYKGSKKHEHGYSGATKELCEFLIESGVIHAYIIGLATDYCVMATALGLREVGFDVTVLIDACRAVNVKPGDGERAVEKMKQAGIKISTTKKEIGNG